MSARPSPDASNTRTVHLKSLWQARSSRRRVMRMDMSLESPWRQNLAVVAVEATHCQLRELGLIHWLGASWFPLVSLVVQVFIGRVCTLPRYEGLVSNRVGGSCFDSISPIGKALIVPQLNKATCFNTHRKQVPLSIEERVRLLLDTEPKDHSEDDDFWFKKKTTAVVVNDYRRWWTATEVHSILTMLPISSLNLQHIHVSIILVSLFLVDISGSNHDKQDADDQENMVFRFTLCVMSQNGLTTTVDNGGRWN